MSNSGTGLEGLIRAAQAGDQVALGQLLHRHRGWLHLFALQKLRQDVRARVGDSDLVQQTLLSALQGFPQFKGSKTIEFQAWLKRIFERNLFDTVRFHVAASRRSVESEQQPNAAIDSLGLGDDALSPSEEVLVGEEAVYLAEALETLPEDQRTAVRLRYLENQSLDEIEQHFGRSRSACAGLIKRGVQTLRDRLTQK